MQALTAHPAEAISGSARAPGDKSVSHRALMLGGLALGESEIEGLLEGEDVLRSAAAMRALGAQVERQADGTWRVCGRGLGGLVEPDAVLDLGNSGTGARLLLGLIAGHPMPATLAGDASLSARPMARVTEPLIQIGARFAGRSGLRLPLTVIGAAEPLPIRYRLPVASAQVKSAILLAGLMAPGETTVIEPVPTRNHSEVMLRHFGATLRIAPDQDAEADGASGTSGQAITLVGQPELTGKRLSVPSDPSSAAFAAVAALLLPGSELRLTGVGTSPARSGLYTTLREMGADLQFADPREENGEPVADLVLRAGPLQGVAVPAERAPAMIDEYPILAVAAAAAQGTTVMQGLGELRVKESDRLAAMARGLMACGVTVEEGADSLTVRGAGGRPRGGNAQPIATSLDHRIAMSFLVLGTVAERPVTIDDGVPIETSFPDFAGFMNRLGARIAPATEAAA
jgi:3-phosphoshikimate 1-carboxyvinyltransferase